ncbi:hypothetical protein [Streptomyces sp. TRM75561]|uniref:hypothetical protein n=1 Tax=Streptomyces sp. TRM75561 TaxID=2975269 RepID=UPI00244907FC|nr:hypothetical protein [Streptomyces sp. TRM75561]MDH3038979.1 hypothetical protein [Streptomyces sp. TRM75561]
MASEIAIAGVGLIGVALGSAGTLAAAYVQRKGSQAQADATYRAAVTTAQVQYAGVLEVQNRQAQRQTYVKFSEAATAFRASQSSLRSECAHWWYGEGAPPNIESLLDPLRLLKSVHGAVELAGPASVMEAADRVVRGAEALTEIYDRAEIPRLEYLLWKGREDHDPQRAMACTLAEEALHELRRVVIVTPPLARTRQLSEGQSAEVQAMAAAFCQAWDAALTQFQVLDGLFDEGQRHLVVNDAAMLGEGSYEERLRHLQERFEEAADGFVCIAREYLNDTQPSIS